ncbi:MAG TPA: hypothetical protein VKF32_09985 [Thermoanaerobaculia bacterium]|nr:hypothetical protein [Thermoanaerobaculia bacterium]
MTKTHRILAGCLSAAALASPALGQGASAEHRADVRKPDGFHVSRPLRDIPPIPPRVGEHRDKPIRLLGVDTTPRPDGAVQTESGPIVAALPTSTGIEGVGLGNGYAVNAAPPDTNGSVGDNQYVQWVNEAFAVFDKASGARIYPNPAVSPDPGGAAGNTIFTGLHTGNCDTNNDGDPIVVFDKQAHRWLMTQFSVASSPYFQCIAVSQTNDATGAWNLYAYSFGNAFNDYPKFGVWPDASAPATNGAYLATYNLFNGGSGADACAYNRKKMLAGDGTAEQVCFNVSSQGLLPSDLDGSNLPAAGSPGYFLRFTTNALQYWKLTFNQTTPSASTLVGPTTVAVASFSPACGGGTCIPQPGTRQQLDSLGDRLMYRLAYRKLASGTESLVVNHSVSLSASRKATSTGVRWYELRVDATTRDLSVAQQSTFSPDSTSRWMGSMAMDKVGNIALGYSKSSSSLNPSIFYTGRLATDPLNTMQAEAQLVLGGGAQQRNLNRWGDYSSFSVDPVDDCTLWYTTEYLASNGTFNWHTAINHIKFPNCQ